jgi:hypothetical protein
LLSDAIVFSFSFFRDRFFTASARAGPGVELSSYQDFSRKSSSFDFRVGPGIIILLSTGRRCFGHQAGGKILRQRRNPVVLDRVLFFSYASIVLINHSIPR